MTYQPTEAHEIADNMPTPRDGGHAREIIIENMGAPENVGFQLFDNILEAFCARHKITPRF